MLRAVRPRNGYLFALCAAALLMLGFGLALEWAQRLIDLEQTIKIAGMLNE
jgi:hypothetical protein